MFFEKPVLICDTREQSPLDFRPFSDRFQHIVRGTLKCGDYSILGHEHLITFERKSLEDLVGTVIRSRERFIKELDKMKQMSYAAIVVEAAMSDVLEHRYRSQASPNSVIGLLQAFQVAYGVDLVWAGSRRNSAEIIMDRIEMYLESVA